jgi:Lipase (class 3)
MLSNLSADPMEEPLLGLSGRVHRGMMQAALYVHNQTGPTLAEAGRCFPGWPLFITGHSLGGMCT